MGLGCSRCARRNTDDFKESGPAVASARNSCNTPLRSDLSGCQPQQVCDQSLFRDGTLDWASWFVPCCVPKRSSLIPGGVDPKERKAQELEKPEVLPYHVISGLSRARGYAGNLTSAEEQSLHKLRELSANTVGPLTPWLLHGETEDRFLLRFLRARNFNVKKALALLSDDVQWRRTPAVRELANMKLQELLGSACTVEMLHHCYPCRHTGYDRQGRPIIYKHCARKMAFMSELLEKCPLETLLRYHTWQQEFYCKLLSEQSRKTGVCVEQLVFILDADGFHLGLISRQVLRFYAGVAAIDNPHYPERLGMVFSVNSPSTLSVLWRLTRQSMSERTQQKIHFCSSRSEMLAELLPIAEQSQLPAEIL